MNKLEFLYILNEKLSNIPDDEREKSVEYYGEILDDYIENGMTESEAVKALGSIDDIVKNVISTIPLSKLIKNKIKSKSKTPAWQIPLLIFGGLIVVPIIISLLAGVFSILVSFWSLVIVFFAVAFSFMISGIAIIPMIILGFIGVEWPFVLMTISGCFILAGLSIPLFYLSKKYLKFMTFITKHTLILIKKCFIKKEKQTNA